MSNENVFVVIPAYNEAQVLGKVLDDLLSYPYQIVVVDDGSQDNTFEIASQYQIHCLQHKCNLGQGAALQTGISYVLKNPDAEIIVTFDADGQHDSKEITKLITPILVDDFDVVLGSRFLEKDLVKYMPTLKYITLKLAVIFTRLTTYIKVTDTHNGFRAFSRIGAQEISITQNGMSHASQILKQIQNENLRYCEVPVTITYTDYSIKKGQAVNNAINILWDSFWSGFN